MKRIKQIKVKNLFGMFNHAIPLHLEDHITIMRSPNGFGKTTILKLLKTTFNGNDTALHTIPFDEFRINFDDNTSFWITKTFNDPTGEDSSRSSKITFHATGQEPYTLPEKTSTSFHNHFTSALVELMIKSAPSGETTITGDTLEKYSDQLSIDSTPAWLTEIKKTLPVRFIETQRLLNVIKSNKRIVLTSNKQSDMTATVSMYSQELVEIIKTKLAESSNLSQSLDRTFPSRVVRAKAAGYRIPENEIRAKLAEIANKRTYLEKTGLLDPGSDADENLSASEQIDESTINILSVYAQDNEEKLGHLDEIANKIDLLKTIINRCFLYKEMTINRNDGFVFTTSNNSKLPLESLSSGEQHELVLFYELLFKVEPGSLVLIDEPEISLHIVWQEQFLQDVLQVAQLTNIDVLIATHSSNIIANRRDLVVKLEGPIYEGL
jgi:predicted ATP-binding protein involved in virulence